MAYDTTIGAADAALLVAVGRRGRPRGPHDLIIAATATATQREMVTVTEPKTAGYLTVYPYGKPRALASNLNFGVGQTIPNLVVMMGHPAS